MSSASLRRHISDERIRILRAPGIDVLSFDNGRLATRGMPISVAGAHLAPWRSSFRQLTCSCRPYKRALARLRSDGRQGRRASLRDDYRDREGDACEGECEVGNFRHRHRL